MKKYIIFVFILFFLNSCVSIPEEYSKINYYLLEPNFIEINGSSERALSVYIDKVEVNDLYDTRCMILKVGRYKFKKDYYRRFFLYPKIMLTDIFKQWSDTFTSNNNVSDDIYKISFYLKDFYVDLTGDKGKTVLSFKVIVRNNIGRVLFYDNYSDERFFSYPSSDVKILSSWNKSMEVILKRLNNDLINTFNIVVTNQN